MVPLAICTEATEDKKSPKDKETREEILYWSGLLNMPYTKPANGEGNTAEYGRLRPLLYDDEEMSCSMYRDG